MWVEIKRDVEEWLGISFFSQPRRYQDLHHVMKDQLAIDNQMAKHSRDVLRMVIGLSVH